MSEETQPTSLMVRLFGTPEERKVRKILREVRRAEEARRAHERWLADAPVREAAAAAERERQKRARRIVAGIAVGLAALFIYNAHTDSVRKATEAALKREPSDCPQLRRTKYAVCPRMKEECDVAIERVRARSCVELSAAERRRYDEGWE
jgi:hypothetical protein